jgi:hypothetical protein
VDRLAATVLWGMEAVAKVNKATAAQVETLPVMVR